MFTLAQEIPSAHLFRTNELIEFIDREGAISHDDMWTACLTGDLNYKYFDARDFVQVGRHPDGNTGFSHVEAYGYPTNWERGDSWDFFTCVLDDPQAVVDAGGIESIIDEAMHGIEDRARDLEEGSVVHEVEVVHHDEGSDYLYAPRVLLIHASPDWEGQAISHAHCELGVRERDRAQEGEAWRFVKTGEGEPHWFIEACGGERGMRLSHAQGGMSLTDMDGEGEKWTIVEIDTEMIRIKALGSERNFFLGHENNETFLLDR